MKDWLFRYLFYQEYDHLRHLIGDVIHLERKLAEYRREQVHVEVTNDSNSTTTSTRLEEV